MISNSFGEPWFIIGLGDFGSSVVKSVLRDFRSHPELRLPHGAIIIEEGNENRLAKAERGFLAKERRRPGLKTLRVEISEGENEKAFAKDGSTGKTILNGEKMPALNAVHLLLQKAIFEAYDVRDYLSRRAPGDDRPVVATVAIVVDIADEFGRVSNESVLECLQKITRVTLAPLFQSVFQNVELVVIAAMPVARESAFVQRNGGLEQRSDLSKTGGEFLSKLSEFAASQTPSDRIYLRTFILDDRSDRYVLSEKDLIDQTTLFLATLLGPASNTSDILADVRSAARERSRKEPAPTALYGTFSVADICYPAELINEYCRLRQAYEMISEFIKGEAEEEQGLQPGRLARDKTNNLHRTFKNSLSERLSNLNREIDAEAKEKLDFEWPPLRVKITTPHTSVGDPSHSELSRSITPEAPDKPIEESGGRIRLIRKYWEKGKVEDRGNFLDRPKFGVKTIQPSDESLEVTPQLDEPKPGTLLGRIRKFATDAIGKFIPVTVHDQDVRSAQSLGEDFECLRKEVTETVSDEVAGWAIAGTQLENIENELKAALGNSTTDLAKQEPNRFPIPKEVLADYYKFRSILEKRPLGRRLLVYTGLAWLGLTLLILGVVPLILGPSFSTLPLNLAIAAPVSALFTFLPLLLRLARNGWALNRAIDDLGLSIDDFISKIKKDFFKKRLDYNLSLWDVRYLKDILARIESSRSAMDRVGSALKILHGELRRRLEKMGVRIVQGPQGKDEFDSSGMFEKRALFREWILPEEGIEGVYARRRVDPAKLAERFLIEQKPFEKWWENPPFLDTSSILDFCSASWRSEDTTDLFSGHLDTLVENAVTSFLKKFGPATRMPLHVQELGDPVDGVYVALVPSSFENGCRSIVDAVGIRVDISPLDEIRERITILKLLYNVDQNRILNIIVQKDDSGHVGKPVVAVERQKS